MPLTIIGGGAGATPIGFTIAGGMAKSMRVVTKISKLRDRFKRSEKLKQ